MTPEKLPDPIRATDSARMAITQMVPGPETSLSSIFRQTNEIVCATLGLERASVWTTPKTVPPCAAPICSSSRKTNTPREHFSGSRISPGISSRSKPQDHPRRIAQTDPRTSELTAPYLVPLGITSMLDAPIIVGAQVVGVVCVEQTGMPREWTTEERDFVGSVADNLALKIRTSELHAAKSALKNQESRVAALEKAEALGQMAAGVAHDFNNLLTVICGNAGLLMLDPTFPRRPRNKSPPSPTPANAEP